MNALQAPSLARVCDVIRSCQTVEQLAAAQRYYRQAWRVWLKDAGDHVEAVVALAKVVDDVSNYLKSEHDRARGSYVPMWKWEEGFRK